HPPREGRAPLVCLDPQESPPPPPCPELPRACAARGVSVMAAARAAVAIREGRRKRGEAFVTILRPPGRDFGPPSLMNVGTGRKIPAKTRVWGLEREVLRSCLQNPVVPDHRALSHPLGDPSGKGRFLEPKSPSGQNARLRAGIEEDTEA